MWRFRFKKLTWLTSGVSAAAEAYVEDLPLRLELFRPRGISAS